MKASLCVFAVFTAMGVLSNNVALAEEAEATTTAEVVDLTYRVLQGNTLAEVAHDFGFEPQAIIDANASREGVLINHCGPRPRRVRANEATLARCAWLRSGVDITIPREVEAPTATPTGMEEESSFSSNREELEAAINRIGEEWPRMRASIYSLHQKIDRQREETRNLSQKNGEISFILKISLAVNIIFLFLLLSIKRTIKKQERGLIKIINEVGEKINKKIDGVFLELGRWEWDDAPQQPAVPPTPSVSVSDWRGQLQNCSAVEEGADRDKKHDTPPNNNGGVDYMALLEQGDYDSDNEQPLPRTFKAGRTATPPADPLENSRYGREVEEKPWEPNISAVAEKFLKSEPPDK